VLAGVGNLTWRKSQLQKGERILLLKKETSRKPVRKGRAPAKNCNSLIITTPHSRRNLLQATKLSVNKRSPREKRKRFEGGKKGRKEALLKKMDVVRKIKVSIFFEQEHPSQEKRSS